MHDRVARRIVDMSTRQDALEMVLDDLADRIEAVEDEFVSESDHRNREAAHELVGSLLFRNRDTLVQPVFRD